MGEWKPHEREKLFTPKESYETVRSVKESWIRFKKLIKFILKVN